ncbi:UNVERIFIED_CONTAM: hypothetical protein PYX00_002495 [Menopon gallinae]|uniref:Uncharacterized protein n=1 Tax=Menopon gallinae TaxID=328185 RepID=A0AAW2IH64_9NEOP
MISILDMSTRSGKVRKRKSAQSKRRKLRAVLKMLAVMEPSSNSPDDPKSEFIVTGRTGRRNAMADILGPNASTSSGDLAERMESLCTAGEHRPCSSPDKKPELFLNNSPIFRQG